MRNVGQTIRSSRPATDPCRQYGPSTWWRSHGEQVRLVLVDVPAPDRSPLVTEGRASGGIAFHAIIRRAVPAQVVVHPQQPAAVVAVVRVRSSVTSTG
jgi:hypothetical protein